jgi:hypothetical protein
MMTSHSTARSIIVAAGLMLAGAGTLLANGQEFFPAGNGPVDLVYFGIVKDASTGRPVRDYAYITIKDRLTGMSIPFTGDKPGHYRSPDIGALIKELGEVADPQRLEMTLVVPGYKKVKLEKMPRKTSGAIEASFKVEREATAAADASTPGTTAPAGEGSGPSGQTVLIALFIGVVMLSVIVGVARTLVPRQSTSH